MIADALRVLVVDDEALARARLRLLLSHCLAPVTCLMGEAASAADALARLQHTPVDVVLLDIHLPGADGLTLARELRRLPAPPAVIFVTAHLAHAVQAFELEALDYLTKPVRFERLQAALHKVLHWRGHAPTVTTAMVDARLVVQDRGRIERLPLSEVLYFKAELKYLRVHTLHRTWLWEAALSDLEARYSEQFLRIHRNALVARSAVRALEKLPPAADGDGWVLHLNGVTEPLAVSRRQLSVVRQAVFGC